MEKLKMRTPDFTDDNIAKIAELFPNCVTEVKEPRMDPSSLCYAEARTNGHELKNGKSIDLSVLKKASLTYT